MLELLFARLAVLCLFKFIKDKMKSIFQLQTEISVYEHYEYTNNEDNEHFYLKRRYSSFITAYLL